ADTALMTLRACDWVSIRTDRAAAATESAWLTTDAAFDAAFPTDKAFDAAVLTMLTALLTVLTCESTEGTATEPTETRLESADFACAETADSSFDVTLAVPPPRSMRVDSAACATEFACDSTESALDTTSIADFAWTLTAESSLEVTLPAPPVTPSIRVLSAA